LPVLQFIHLRVLKGKSDPEAVGGRLRRLDGSPGEPAKSTPVLPGELNFMRAALSRPRQPTNPAPEFEFNVLNLNLMAPPRAASIL
jgi:hypothetical protein